MIGEDRPATNQEALFFFSAQRRRMASASFFRPAGVMPPRRLGEDVLAAAAVVVFPRRSAQRRFIASDKRRLPAAVRPLRGRPGPLVFAVPTTTLASSRRAAIARPSRSLSDFNSLTILFRSTGRSLIASDAGKYASSSKKLQLPT